MDRSNDKRDRKPKTTGDRFIADKKKDGGYAPKKGGYTAAKEKSSRPAPAGRPAKSAAERQPVKPAPGRRPAHEDGRTVARSSFSEPVPGAVIGRNAVRELLKSGRTIDKLLVRRGDREGSIVVLVAEAVNRGIPVVEVDTAKLDDLSGGGNHQGVLAMAAEKEYTDVDSMLAAAAERGEKPLLVIADGIEDPWNLGALIRCAECAGAHGVIIPKRGAVGLTPAVTKASAGAIEHMPIAKVANIAGTIEDLKKKGVWVFAAEAGGVDFYDVDFDVPAAIVLGSEGNGISRLVREKSDYTVSIPMYGQVNSLNVSTAASVILTRAARMQRSTKKA